MSPGLEKKKLRYDDGDGSMAMTAGLEDVRNLFMAKERRSELREDELLKLNEM